MNLSKNILLTLAIAFAAFTGFAGEDYTLPSGRVLKNAYIMERKPDGVTVGHSTGVMFIKYKDMPVELRKKLGYDKKEYDDYEKRKREAQKAQQKYSAKKRAEEAKIHKEREARIEKYKITELEDKIKATELHIQRLKKEIPKMEEDSKTYLNDAVKLSSESSDSGSGSGFWRNGYWSSSNSRAEHASRTEVKKRYKAVQAIGDEYSKTKFRLENSKDTLEKEILDLDKMKRRLKELKKEQKSKGKEKSKGGLFSSLF